VDTRLVPPRHGDAGGVRLGFGQLIDSHGFFFISMEWRSFGKKIFGEKIC
jgi:hypothetical protein